MNSTIVVSHYRKVYSIHLNKLHNYRTFAAFNHDGKWIAKGRFDDDCTIEILEGSLLRGICRKFELAAYEQIFKVTSEDRFAISLISDAFHFTSQKNIDRIALDRMNIALTIWIKNPVRSSLSQLRKSLISAGFQINPEIDVKKVMDKKYEMQKL